MKIFLTIITNYMWYFSIIKVKKLAAYFLIKVLMKKESIYIHKNTTIREEIPHLYSMKRLVVVLRQIP